MADLPINPGGPRGALQKAAFEAGDVVTACDLNLEQEYRIQLLRHHLRYLHGWGVVCGLKVAAVLDPRRPWLIRVCPGYGVGPCGDEMLMPKAIDYDIRDAMWTRPGSQIGVLFAYIALKYVSEPADFIAVPALGCGCNE